MPSHVLGISCFYHDAAAALVRDGEIVAAAEEERFTRRKHDAGFPSHAVQYCLDEAGITANDVDLVMFYENPVLSLDRNLTTFLSVAPRGRERWGEFADTFLARKVLLAREIRQRLNVSAPIRFTRHHLSHGASAFYPSPFEDAAVLTVDGVGEWETTSIAHGVGTQIRPLTSIRFPHSLGLLYSAFTGFCGFRVNSGEYKLMGLAPYGRPRYADTIREHLLHPQSDGSFRLGLEYFGFLDGDRLTNARFAELFGGGPRRPESRITSRETDLAASVQLVTQEAVLGLARHARELTGSKNLCMAGGVALNCVVNGQLQRAGLFENIWVQPAAGDAGGALGAALLGAHVLLDEPRRKDTEATDGQRGSLLGPSYAADDLRALLDELGCAYEEVPDPDKRAVRIAEHLAAGDVVGLCSGPMEFGPRALGSRSILADPRRPDTQSRLNLKVKFRESFRPFAPAVLAEACQEYFDFSGGSPYMLMTAPVREERRVTAEPDEASDGDTDADLLALVRQVRSDVPAVTHVDHSARLQTVGPGSNPEFRAVLEAFRALTGCPVLVNTSMNVRGEPIVCTPHDAWECYRRTDIDVLVVNHLIVTGKPTAAAPPVNISEDQQPVPAPRPADGTSRSDLFFGLFLAPLAERLGEDFRRRLAAEGVDGSAYSPAETGPTGGEFWELESLDAIGEQLRGIWSAYGFEDANALVRPLMELTEEIIGERRDIDLGEVTPYIYTLF
ncbi:carbamoyltransferase [Streptomyces mirabilis]|uniref:carbamoyltransferase family protein n=1 Tax=Streptomyces mirabilis TaxID=68239 RepID=UPI0036B2A85C